MTDKQSYIESDVHFYWELLYKNKLRVPQFDRDGKSTIKWKDIPWKEVEFFHIKRMQDNEIELIIKLPENSVSQWYNSSVIKIGMGSDTKERMTTTQNFISENEREKVTCVMSNSGNNISLCKEKK